MASEADDLLWIYREKRDFAETAEPAGETTRLRRGGRKGLSFCIQKHEATRLHYDFRVEWQGVLKSWAVTRGPSLNSADKRLAVRTEDHPLDYGDFEGTIPAGHYGGGTVMLWDRGTWEPEPGTDPEEGLSGGNLKMVLHGERMNGRWALIRMKPRGKETRENWLLIKEKDETATPDGDLLSEDRSVKTGRDMAAIAEGGEAWDRPTRSPAPSKQDQSKRGVAGAETITAPLEKTGAALAKAPAAGKKPKTPSGRPLPVPAFREPQLATLVDRPPEGEGWIHEMKYDGYRVMIAIGGGRVKLYTRSGLDWTDRFAAIRPAAEALACRSALIDGEVVAFDENGRTDFSTLQAHLKEGGALSCFCFDLLELDGIDLAKEPLSKRKDLLAALLKGAESETLLFSEHIAGKGAAVLESICKAGHEGIVAKRADAPYRSGRGKSWLKIKCTRRQEFVVGGWSASDKKGRAFSSILVGLWENGSFVYRGRVGSGFDDSALDALAKRFELLAVANSPFAELPAAIRRGAHFVKPELVAEIDFAEITADGQIRHGVFKGLCEDKPAREVTGDMPTSIKTANERKASTKELDPEGKPKSEPKTTSKGDAVIAGVVVTHPGREVFPGIRKRDIAAYYEAVADRMLAFAGNHAISLVRHPQGPNRKGFFQKHDSGGFPEAIRKVPIAEKDGGTEDYLYVRDAAGLVAAVQMNALEIHIWGAPVRRIETPDRIVFDLDPDEGLPFPAVRDAAMDLRNLLDHLGLQSFALVTGGKGVHVVVPLTGRQDWSVAKGFARDLATKLADGDPDRFVATMSKAKRKGRIFIDWLRNERGATAIAPYSTRARDGAPVAVPVSWKELETLERANGFDMSAVLARLKEPDPWSSYPDVRQSLTNAVLTGLAKL